MRVAVAGGTGVVGRHIVASLRSSGNEPVVLSRSNGVDLTSGLRLEESLSGCAAVIDVTNVQTLKREVSLQFFSKVTDNLLTVGQRVGVRNFVALSIVGIDKVDSGYYEGKRKQEELMLASGLPVTIQRATQFHEFSWQMLNRGRKGPFVVVPKMLIQPVAAQDVGTVLADLALTPAMGRAPDFGGPGRLELTDMVRRLIAAQGKSVRVVGIRVPGEAGRAMASGALTLGLGARISTLTYQDWLAATFTKV